MLVNAFTMDDLFFTIFDWAGIEAQRQMRGTCKSWHALAEKASKLWIQQFLSQLSLDIYLEPIQGRMFLEMNRLQANLDHQLDACWENDNWKVIRQFDQTVTTAARINLWIWQSEGRSQEEKEGHFSVKQMAENKCEEFKTAKDGTLSLESFRTKQYLVKIASVALCIPILAGFTGLRRLKLSGLELEQIPPQLATITSLTSLYLSNNKLQDLPETFSGLTNLVSLHLFKNDLCEIPSVILKLRKLTFLDLSQNEIIWIPPEIDRLQFLKTLLLKNNRICHLPRQLENLLLLKTFSCRKNYLNSIPMKVFAILDSRKQKSWNVKRSTNIRLSLPKSLEEREVISCEGTT